MGDARKTTGGQRSQIGRVAEGKGEGEGGSKRKRGSDKAYPGTGLRIRTLTQGPGMRAF